MATYNGSCSPATSSAYPVISATVSASSGSSGTVTCSYTLQWYSTGAVNWGSNTTSTLTLTCNGKTATNNTHAATAINVSGSGTKNLVSGSLTVTGVGSGSKSWSLVWKRPTMNVWYGSTNIKSFSCTASGTISVPAAYTKCGAPTLTINKTSAYMGDQCTVTYKNASGGTNNSINGYTIQWSHDKNSWSNYGSKVNTTANNGSFNHSEVSVTGWMYFRMRTEGSAGSGYYSDWSNVVGCYYSEISAPSYARYIITEDGSYDEYGDSSAPTQNRTWCAMNKTFRAKWTAGAGATSYQIRLMRRNSAGTAWEEYSSSYWSTTSTTYDVQLPNRNLYPGDRNNDLWYNVRSVRNGRYSAWVGPSYGYMRSAAIKIFDGSSWKNGAVWIYNGSKWIPAKYVNVYNSGAWKRSKLF